MFGLQPMQVLLHGQEVSEVEFVTIISQKIGFVEFIVYEDWILDDRYLFQQHVLLGPIVLEHVNPIILKRLQY
jgi:hypothetical protein